MPNSDVKARITGHLPTNIEQLTPEFIEANLPAWDEKISKMLASLRASGYQTSADRVFIFDAEQRAKVEDTTTESAFQWYTDGLKQSTYPTPDCLFPDEVVEYVLEQHFPAERLKHAEHCNACATLLIAALPAGSRLQQDSQMTSNLDDLLLQTPQPGVARDNSWGPWLVSQLRILASISGRVLSVWITMISPALMILLVMYVVLQSMDRAAASLTIPAKDGFWVAALAGSLLCLVIFRGFESIPKVRQIGSGCVLALVCAFFLMIDYQQGKATAAIAFDWARNKTEQFVLTAMEQKQPGHMYPDKRRATDIFDARAKDIAKPSINIEVAQNSDTKAIYIVTIPEIQEKITAELQLQSAMLTLDIGNKAPEKISLLLGTVEKDSQHPDKEVVVADLSGASYSMPSDPSLPLPGTRVVATVNPATFSVERYLALNIPARGVPPRNASTR